MVFKSITKEKNIVKVNLSLKPTDSISKSRSIASKKLLSYLKDKRDIPKSIEYFKKENKKIKNDFIVSYFYKLKY